MPLNIDRLYDLLLVPPGKRISLKEDYDPCATRNLAKKSEARNLLAVDIRQLATQQSMLYAQNNYALLIVLQGMDAAGKDGLIKHVMSGVNPQGTQIVSFKAPTTQELDHTYLWRNFKVLPERGTIGIFNRSHYEEVLIARVHPEVLDRQQLPPKLRDSDIWKRRFTEINNFEQYLVNNGTIVLKFFLNISKEEQKKRFLERIDRPEKNWKFSSADARERLLWNKYQSAYEDMLNNTSTKHAPWYVVPADRKWFSRLAVGAVILQTLKRLNLSYPVIDKVRRKELLKAKKMLESEA